jgi:hypothetical protein
VGLAVKHPVAHGYPCEEEKTARVTCEDLKEVKMVWGQRWEEVLSLVVLGYLTLATLSDENELYQWLWSHH